MAGSGNRRKCARINNSDKLGNRGQRRRSSALSGTPSVRLKCRPDCRLRGASRKSIALANQCGALLKQEVLCTRPSCASSTMQRDTDSDRPKSSAFTIKRRVGACRGACKAACKGSGNKAVHRQVGHGP